MNLHTVTQSRHLRVPQGGFAGESRSYLHHREDDGDCDGDGDDGNGDRDGETTATPPTTAMVMV